MAEVRNDVSRFGGEYMIQDRDHMSDIAQTSDRAGRSGARQSEQSQSEARQQGSGDASANPQGGQRRRSL